MAQTARTPEISRSAIDSAVEGMTLVDVLSHNARKYPDRPAIHWKAATGWKNLTWSQYQDEVHTVAAGLASLEIGTAGTGSDGNDFVAVMAGNRPEHVIADLGSIHAGATCVTIYSTLTPPQIAYIVNNCQAKVAIVENATYLKQFEAIKDDISSLTHVVVMDADEDYAPYLDADWTLTWKELLARGKEKLKADPEVVQKGVGQIAPNTLATLIYTSGTTGTPKGVEISHYNVVWTAESVKQAVPELPDHPRMVSYLPLAHIAERMSTHYFGLYVVGEVYYCPDLNQVLDYLQEARPDLFVAVPRVWEKFYARLQSRFEDNPRRDMIKKAVAHNEKVVRMANGGVKVGLKDRITTSGYDRIVFAKVREQMGLENVVVSVSSAAPISSDLLVFFAAIGVPIYELYGMSETTGPAIGNLPGANRIGTVGRAFPGVEVKIADDGEVLMRGGNISAGYYKMDEETAETFDDDGWIHSGDLGRLDNGYLSIVGRKKEIIITAAGKNIAPAKLEGELRNHPLVAQACMIGDQRKYLTMLIALDAEAAPEWCKANDVKWTNLADLSENKTVIGSIQDAIDAANKSVAPVEQVKKFYIAPNEWTPETGELTPSLKLKRRVVLDEYAKEIDALYPSN